MKNQGSFERENGESLNFVRGIVVGITLALLLSLQCTRYLPDSHSDQKDETDACLYLPLMSRKRSCCRWNHYVVNGGGGQTALAVNPVSPNIVYVAMDNGGIAKSTDHGDYWQTINNNIGNTCLADIELDPLNPDILYVTAVCRSGSGEGELYRSLDGGAHWEFLTDAFGVEKWPSSRSIVIIPQDTDGDRISDVIYAGAWAGDSGGDKGGIWKSADEGATWQQIGHVDGDSEFLRQANVWVLRNDPSDPDVLYAGMFVYEDADTPGGIFRSTDSGLNWVDISGNIPVPNISDIAISPDGVTLYAATNAFSMLQPAGIYKSTTAGSAWVWTPINRGLGETSLQFQVLLVDKNDPNVLYTGPFRGNAKGIYKTVDGGEYWYRTIFDHSDWWEKYFDNTWAIAEGTDSKLYAATWKGIYRGDDSGETWLARNQGLGNVIVYDITLDPQNPSTVYLGLGDVGPWKSTDGGHTWSRIKEGYFEPYGASTGGVAALAVSHSNPDIIYSAVKGPSGSTLMGVNKTVNGGQTWQAVNNGLPSPDTAWVATDVVVHPLTPDVAYVGIKTDAGTGGVFETTDGGASWTELTNVVPEGDLPRVESLAISASDPDVLLVGTWEPGRVYKTDDGGESWSLISPPQDLMDPNTIIYDIDIHPLHPDLIIVGVNNQGAYKTTDGGQTWTHVLDASFFQENVGDLALNPGKPINATIKAVLFDPDDPQIIYIGHYNRGMAGFGVVRSTDGGASWTFINDSGLQYRNVFAMDIHPQTKELFVGGFDGVYVYELFLN
ncbi:MAG: hypothetical protein SXV54_05130 [Chloroflexota bacterium]|nr:hypothetical protein [Chloroflexota bacterium]